MNELIFHEEIILALKLLLFVSLWEILKMVLRKFTITTYFLAYPQNVINFKLVSVQLLISGFN